MRSKEEQCEHNILSVLQHYDFPEPLVLLECREDRCFFEPTGEFYEHLSRLITCHLFANWSLFIKGHGATAIHGWREGVPTCSLQIISHLGNRIECDFDCFNPDYGALYAFLHLLEVIFNSLTQQKTDPFRVAEKLKKRGIRI